MNRRKLVDVDMEQTGEALKSPSYAARQANANTANQRLKNPATGQSWFETPSAEYQFWEEKNRRLDLEDRAARDDQEFRSNMRRLEKFEPKKNDEAIRTLGNELQTRNKALGSELQTRNKALGNELAIRLPYATFEKSADLFGGAKALASVMPSFDTLRYQKGVSMSL